ncbi:hypothetical protein ABE10_02275, partial [Bacillus toyonensis]|nr:hypothetical protein [Bacillus toyonensis]
MQTDTRIGRVTDPERTVRVEHQRRIDTVDTAVVDHIRGVQRTRGVRGERGRSGEATGGLAVHLSIGDHRKAVTLDRVAFTTAEFGHRRERRSRIGRDGHERVLVALRGIQLAVSRDPVEESARREDLRELDGGRDLSGRLSLVGAVDITIRGQADLRVTAAGEVGGDQGDDRRSIYLVPRRRTPDPDGRRVIPPSVRSAHAEGATV